MKRRWVPAPAPRDAGARVHGPLLLGEAPGIRAELDHVQAHAEPAGLALHVLVRAEGVQAEAARRQVSAEFREPLDPAGGRPDLGSRPVLRVAIGDLDDEVHPAPWAVRTHEDRATGEVRFSMEGRCWVDELPADGRVRVSVSWRQAGLPESHRTLVLPVGGPDVPDAPRPP
ncbi:hypothetical protein [Kineococcus gypseus]|uniref:hypothetical protein n=1 Tax=Kineococcus gypseus TaxID=1637102 RepID=UPI003D7EBBA4